MLKVLWFSLSPCGSLRREGQQKITQTWMTTLEDELKQHAEVDLSVAYYSQYDSIPFDYEGVHYYPIARDRRTIYDKLLYRYCGYQIDETAKHLSRMERVVKLVNPDIIHVHGTELDFGLITERVPNIPVVVSIQGLMSVILEKYYAGITREEDGKVNRYSKVIYSLFKRNAEQERRILSNVRYVIGRTSWDSKISALFNPTRRYFVVNEIMRDDFFDGQWRHVNSNKLRLVSVLSPGIYKGYKTLLKTAAILKSYGNIDFEWAVIGCSIADMYVKCSITSTEIDPIVNHIQFLGRKSAKEIVDCMRDSDIFVQTGHIENSPNALCEAMVFGMPCIASNVGGTSSMLNDRMEGILYQDGDPYLLASEILALYRDPARAQTMAEHARTVARNRHNAKSVCQELLAAYSSVLQDFRHNDSL